jgi:hypothetical protein
VAFAGLGGVMPRSRRPARVAAPIPLEQTAFVGVRDSLDPSTADPRFAYLLRNVYPEAPAIGGAVVGRPGFVASGLLGSNGRRAVQGSAQYTLNAGNELTVVFVGGYMYRYDWGTSVWILVADLATSHEVSETNRIYCVSLGGYLIISDGTVSPLAWDGTAFTQITNCPALFGPPTIYYAKVVGISAAERRVIVWSDENDPFVGYDSADHAYSWELSQTSDDPLVALKATNAALYFWRARSVGKVVGRIDVEMVTAGTHDDVSTTVGTLSPASVFIAGPWIYFLDADRRPQRIAVGGGLDPDLRALDDAAQTFGALPLVLIGTVCGVHYEAADLALFALGSSGAAALDRVGALDARSGVFAGYWDGFLPRYMGVVRDGSGAPRLLHGDTTGTVYLHARPDGDVWDDAGAAIACEVEGSPLGYDAALEKAFLRIDVSLRSGPSAVTLSYTTPTGASSPLADVPVTASATASDAHVTAGWSGRGRWVRPRVLHAEAGERFGLLGWTVWAQPLAPTPGVR